MSAVRDDLAMSSEVWAHCDDGHEWIVCKLPMEVGAAGRQMQRNGKCPHCNKRGYIGRAVDPAK